MLRARATNGLRVVGAPHWGQCAQGQGPGGAQDHFSCITGNRLLQQDDYTPLLEGTLHGAHLTIDHDTYAVCTGAQVDLTLNHQPLPRGAVFYWPAQTPLVISPNGRGLRWYLAIIGGIEQRDGGWQTQPLAGSPPSLGQRYNLRHLLRWAPRDGHLRVLPGPEWGRLGDGLPDSVWRVDERSNGMGLRLHGADLGITDFSMTSGPVTAGLIQATPAGPIVLLRDCQTVGGYPRIGRIISCDIDRAAQFRPGSPLYLDLIEPALAEIAVRERNQALDQLNQPAHQ